MYLMKYDSYSSSPVYEYKVINELGHIEHDLSLRYRMIFRLKLRQNILLFNI